MFVPMAYTKNSSNVDRHVRRRWKDVFVAIVALEQLEMLGLLTAARQSDDDVDIVLQS